MRGRIKLLFVIENACYGGGERTFSLLIRNLPADRYEVYCASLAAGRFHEEVRAYCSFLPLDLTKRFNPGNVGRLKRLMQQHGVQIAHSQGARADFYCALAAAGAGIKSIATVAVPVEDFDVCPLRRSLYSALNSYAARRTAAAITVNRHLADRLRGRYRHVEVIPNPVDLQEFNPSNFNAGPVIEKFGLRGRLVIGSLGRLERYKGHWHLLEALKIIFGREPQLREKLKCLIAGSGSLEARLKKRAEKDGLSGNVIFCGEVSEPRDFLGAVDIFVLPSLREGQPLALLEAMAMEKPVVASDIPGVSSVAEAGLEALLVPPADPEALTGALLKLVNDMPAALALGRAAGRKAAGFGLQPFLAAHDSFYRVFTGGGN